MAVLLRMIMPELCWLAGAPPDDNLFAELERCRELN